MRLGRSPSEASIRYAWRNAPSGDVQSLFAVSKAGFVKLRRGPGLRPNPCADFEDGLASKSRGLRSPMGHRARAVR
jgi:hypothetical protein